MARVAQLRRELLGGDRQVEADADHRPAVLGAGLDQDPGQLAALDLDVVRPLDAALDPGRQLLGGLADGQRHGQRQQRVALVERPQERRVEQRLAGRRGPGAALAAAPRGLLGGGDDGPVRRTGRGQLAGAGVGRVGAARSGGAGVRRSSSARRRRAGRRAGRRRRGARLRRRRSRPAARAVSLVTGPIETTRAAPGKRSPSASVRFVTVEEEVKVT